VPGASEANEKGAKRRTATALNEEWVAAAMVMMASVTPPSPKMTALPGSRRGILGEARIHKYMHRSPNNSVLNIELLQFKGSNLIHQSSCSGIINDKQKLILLTIHR
jgi:hypothetical protein